MVILDFGSLFWDGGRQDGVRLEARGLRFEVRMETLPCGVLVSRIAIAAMHLMVHGGSTIQYLQYSNRSRQLILRIAPDSCLSGTMALVFRKQ